MRTLSTTLKVLIALAMVAAFAVGAFFWRAYAAKRSLPGKIVRWFRGEAGAHQTVNDLAEDIRQSAALANLQPWSLEALARFSSGQIRTNGSSPAWPFGGVILAAEERPGFVTEQWGLTNRLGQDSPEISVIVSTNGLPDAVIFAWYLHGIVVGPPGYRLTFQNWYQVEAKPGVFVYHLYK